MSEKPLAPTTNKQPSGNQKAEQAVSIQTKVSSFTEVQRSLEEIKNVLNTLSAKQIPDGVTDESETEGTPGSIRIVKNDLDQSLFEIKTEDGWKKPMVGKTAVTFETIENNQKPIRAESIDEIEANDETTGDNKANNTIYDEKASKFVLPRPDWDSGWYGAITTNSTYSITHNLNFTGDPPKLFFYWISDVASPKVGTNKMFGPFYTQHNSGAVIQLGKNTIAVETDNHAICGEGGSGAGNPDGVELTSGYIRIFIWK